MHNHLSRIFLALIFVAFGVINVSANTMHVSETGTGQVLLFPYYTARSGNASLMSLVNTTTQGKTVRVTVREARGGFVVAQFNLYLSAKDVWTGAIVSDADGAQLVSSDTSCTSPAFAVNPNLFPVPYDTIKDFAPIATIARTRQILVVNPSLPVKNLHELIALARAKPGQINFSSSGTGNTNHLAGEILNSLAGVKMQHVPYKGAGPAVTDLIGGQVQVSFQVPISVIPHIRSGRLRPMAISGKTRIPALPQVPVFAEAGLPAFDIAGWTGMFAPAATPPDVVDKISSEMAKVLALPDIVERLTTQGMEPLISNPEQFAGMIKADMVKFAKVIKDANIKAD